MKPMTAVLLALPFALAAAPAVHREDPAEVLRAADLAFCRATRAHGLEGWLSWFAADAIVFPPEGALAVGAAAVRKHYAAQPGFPPAGFLWEPERAGISAAGDFGWTIGRAGTDEGGQPVWRWQYLTVWKKQDDGSWRVLSDCGYDAQFATRLTGLAGPPATQGREREHLFVSAGGEYSAALGGWWAEDGAGREAGGKYLSVWRRNADGSHELVAETGLQQARR